MNIILTEAQTKKIAKILSEDYYTDSDIKKLFGDGSDTDQQTGQQPDQQNFETNGRWIDSVKKVYAAFTGRLFGGKYSQTKYCTPDEAEACGLKPSKIRSDCSGFVSACLREYGVGVGNLTSAGMENLSLPRFQRIEWGNKPVTGNESNAPQGTIFVAPGRHVVIYAGNNKCWDFGNNRKQSNGEPVSGSGILNKKFKIAYIPTTSDYTPNNNNPANSVA